MTGSFITSLWRVDAERVHAVRLAALGLGLTRAQVLQTLLERGDLTEPTSIFGLDEALLGVLGHLVDAAKLRRIHTQEPASRADLPKKCTHGVP